MFPGKDLSRLEEEFYEMVYDGWADEKSYSIVEHLLNVLKETPIKYQMEYMDGELGAFEEGVEEGYIEI